MKIEDIKLSRTRNDEHFQLMTDFKRAIEKYGGATVLKIQTEYNNFLLVYNQEDEALKKIMKSIITKEIHAADNYRDQIFRGMTDTVKAALNNFKPEVVAAAEKLKIVFDTYGNVGQKPLNEETSAIYNLLQDLFMKYKDEAMKTAIMDWMYELQNANEKFKQIMESRYEESAFKTDLVLKEVRVQMDIVYRSIVDKINAYALVADDKKPFNDFITYFNEVIEKYKNTLAKRI